jgi:hypothetical protein
MERALAKARLSEAGRLGGKGSGKLPEASKGRATDKAVQPERQERAEAYDDAIPF